MREKRARSTPVFSIFELAGLARSLWAGCGAADAGQFPTSLLILSPPPNPFPAPLPGLSCACCPPGRHSPGWGARCRFPRSTDPRHFRMHREEAAGAGAMQTGGKTPRETPALGETGRKGPAEPGGSRGAPTPVPSPSPLTFKRGNGAGSLR